MVHTFPRLLNVTPFVTIYNFAIFCLLKQKRNGILHTGREQIFCAQRHIDRSASRSKDILVLFPNVSSLCVCVCGGGMTRFDFETFFKLTSNLRCSIFLNLKVAIVIFQRAFNSFLHQIILFL